MVTLFSLLCGGIITGLVAKRYYEKASIVLLKEKGGVMNTGIYLKKENLTEMSPNELIAFMQITRIIASLRFWMTSLIKIDKDEDKLFKVIS